MIIIGMLGLHVLILGTTAILASRDRNFVVIPNAYQEGLNFDKTQAAMRASESLGWTLKQCRVSEKPVDELGNYSILVELTGPDNKPVVGAAVAVNWQHKAFGGEIHKLALITDAGGRATGVGRFSRTGGYVLHIEATLGQGPRFITSTERLIERGGR